jgi:hypothetical protein
MARHSVKISQYENHNTKRQRQRTLTTQPSKVVSTFQYHEYKTDKSSTINVPNIIRQTQQIQPRSAGSMERLLDSGIQLPSSAI